MSQFWFGEPWPRADHRASVCEDDEEQIATPVGEKCLLCSEEIVAGDRGTTMGSLKPGELNFVHVACTLREVTGNHLHLQGRCKMAGECVKNSTLTFRQEALEVWGHLTEGKPWSVTEKKSGESE